MSSRVVEQRLAKLLEMRTDGAAMQEALAAVSSVGGGGVSKERLRSDIEARDLEVIEAFIARMTPMEERLLTLDSSVRALSTACDAARGRIEQSEADTASFLAAAEALTTRRAELERQLAEVNGVLSQYELKPEEAAALAAGPALEDGGAGFFDAIARVSAIREQSLALITGKDQALGLELLEAATQQQVRRRGALESAAVA
jgi:hypothetical protein